MRDLLGLSLAARLRRWKKEFQNEKYYYANFDTVYSYIFPLPGNKGFQVDFRIFCNHPLKAAYCEDGRTAILRRSFSSREKAESFLQAELQRAAPFFHQSHFYMARVGSGFIEQYW
ncbi:hypothetical protein V9K67_22260 [Paraflavisolibacter sp. H34]|uniref:hypothetical protein n=1 Tax=Huijunlia imazamoxiresistens TaxID=3127457 RepID=UPI00301ADB65